MLPFRAALFSGTAAGGGGGPPAGGDLRTVVGNGNWVAQSVGSTSNGVLIKITTPSGANSLLSAVTASFSGMGAGIGLKALLVADSGGSPANGAPIAIGTATVPGSSVDANLVVDLPFGSGQTLSPSTDYWIGFVPSATVGPNIADANFSNVTSMEVVVTYASPSWNAATDAAGARFAIWAALEQAGAATGLHQQGNSVFLQGASSMRMILPPYALGDRIIINHTNWFGTPQTISGFTEISNEAISGFGGARHRLLLRTIDGTEDGAVFFPAPSANQIAVATVLRGGGAYEGLAHNTGTGTSATSAAVTTSGANRRVFNFLFSGGNNAGTTNTESADTWTDVYALGTTADADYIMSMSCKDLASAGSSGTETRTIGNAFWHVSSLAIPDA